MIDSVRLRMFARAFCDRCIGRPLRGCLSLGVTASLLLGLAAPATALSPDSPQVKAAVGRGVAYLQRNLASGSPSHVGGISLVVMAMLKSGVRPSQPTIDRLLREVQSNLSQPTFDRPYYEVYSLGVTIMALEAIDGEKYKSQISACLAQLLKLQRQDGGFADRTRPGSDTSMTQYGMLGIWAASNAGITVPDSAVEANASYFIRTQRPEGGFVYTPWGGSNNQTSSLTVAGLGCMYIAANHFGLETPHFEQPSAPRSGGIRAVPIEIEMPELKRRNTRIDNSALNNAITKAANWLDQNWSPSVGDHFFYASYGLERFQSFREHSAGTSEPEPVWYTTVGSRILSEQKPDGSWEGSEGAIYDTCFSILFLVRSTKQSLHHVNTAAGTLVGGRGLPDGSENLTLKDGKVTVRPLAGPAGDLLAILDDPSHPEYQSAIEGVGEWTAKADDAMLSEHLLKLRALAGSNDPGARLTAVRALSRSSDLNNCPTLIYALSDPDPQVMLEARDGLRFISRKFEGFGLTAQASNIKRREVIEAWKAWYRTIRPDGDLPD